MTFVVQEKGYYGDQRFWGKEAWLKAVKAKDVVRCEMIGGQICYGILQDDTIFLLDNRYDEITRNEFKLTGERVLVSDVKLLEGVHPAMA